MDATRQSSVRLEEVICPGCNRPTSQSVFMRADQYDKQSRQWCVRACECGIQFVSPRPRYEDMCHFYPDYYSVPRPSAGILSAAEQWYRQDLLAWESRMFCRLSGIKAGVVLDVGTGSGDRLESLHRVGFTPIGIEPFAKHNARIPFGSLEEAVLAGQRFDSVMFNNSFEHLHDPAKALADCRRLLTPQGVLLIVIPNRGSIQARFFKKKWAAYDLPRDLYFYTIDELKALVTGAGFKTITLKTLNPILHPPTLVLSLFPALDPRLNFRDRRGWATKIRILLWICVTIIVAPVAWIESRCGMGSLVYAFFRNSHEQVR